MSHADDLVKEIVDLKAKLNAARQNTRLWKKRVDEAAEYIKEHEEIKAENKRLREALEKYGDHSKECHDEKYPEAWHCICGYEQALKGVEYLK